MKMKRVQGEAWELIKPHLDLISCSTSDNGRVRVVGRHKKFKDLYCHWLNPNEQKTMDLSKLPETKFKNRENVASNGIRGNQN